MTLRRTQKKTQMMKMMSTIGKNSQRIQRNQTKILRNSLRMSRNRKISMKGYLILLAKSRKIQKKILLKISMSTNLSTKRLRMSQESMQMIMLTTEKRRTELRNVLLIC